LLSKNVEPLRANILLVLLTALDPTSSDVTLLTHTLEREFERDNNVAVLQVLKMLSEHGNAAKGALPAVVDLFRRAGHKNFVLSDGDTWGVRPTDLWTIDRNVDPWNSGTAADWWPNQTIDVASYGFDKVPLMFYYVDCLVRLGLENEALLKILDRLCERLLSSYPDVEKAKLLALCLLDVNAPKVQTEMTELVLRFGVGFMRGYELEIGFPVRRLIESDGNAAVPIIISRLESGSNASDLIASDLMMLLRFLGPKGAAAAPALVRRLDGIECRTSGEVHFALYVVETLQKMNVDAFRDASTVDSIKRFANHPDNRLRETVRACLELAERAELDRKTD